MLCPTARLADWAGRLMLFMRWPVASDTRKVNAFTAYGEGARLVACCEMKTSKEWLPGPMLPIALRVTAETPGAMQDAESTLPSGSVFCSRSPGGQESATTLLSMRISASPMVAAPDVLLRLVDMLNV